jgi:hypothetical protein
VTLREQLDPELKLLSIHQSRPDELHDEVVVVLTAGGELRERKIVALEAPGDHACITGPDRGQVDPHQAVLPAAYIR